MTAQNAMRSESRTKPSAAMDGAPLKLEHGDHDAFQRALAQITDRSAQLVAEAIEQNAAKGHMNGNVRQM